MTRKAAPVMTYADADHFRAFTDSARPGDSYYYAVGPHLNGGQHPTALLARELEQQQVVRLDQRPHDAPDGARIYYYRATKREPLPPVCDAGPACAPDPDAAALLRVLTGLAREGLPLPSNETLAEMAGLPDRKAAAYRTDKLERAGLIAVRRIGTLPGGGAAREIEISGKGLVTRSRVERVEGAR